MSDTAPTGPDFGTAASGIQAVELGSGYGVQGVPRPDQRDHCGHDPYPVPFMTIGGHVVLFGFAIKETSGTASAAVDLFDGTDANELLSVPITLNPGESSSDGPWARGLHFREGLFYRATSGATIGSMYVCLRH